MFVLIEPTRYFMFITGFELVVKAAELHFDPCAFITMSSYTFLLVCAMLASRAALMHLRNRICMIFYCTHIRLRLNTLL